MIFGLGSCGGGGSSKTIDSPKGIVLSMVPSRTSGVAPLSVFFDATGTTDIGVTTRPFHDLEYSWDFGDTNAGTWTYGTQPGVNSKNSATGPVASHVFENPGTYQISLTAFDGINTSTTSTTITVQDANTVFSGTNTICIASTTVPIAGSSGCPAGATTVQQSNFVTAIGNYASSGKRVLFKRGDTFTAASTARIDKTGPGIVGAYGAGGPAPKVQMAGSATILTMSSPTTPNIGDWRIMDFDFDGMSNANGIVTDGGFNHFLALRMNIHEARRGITAGASILDWWNTHGDPGHQAYDDWAIVDSTLTNLAVCDENSGNCDWRVELDGKHISIQGNLLDGMSQTTTVGQHVLRSGFINKGVISNNNIRRAGRQVIKLHAPGWTGNSVNNPGGIGTYTEKVVISDNQIAGTTNPWTVTLGPQDQYNDERVRDVIVERNWFTAGSGVSIHTQLFASQTTIRNNIFDMTGGNQHQGINVTIWGGSGGGAPAPTDNRIYNNTFYSSSSGDFTAINIDSTAVNLTARNNLGSAPNASGRTMISGTGSGLIQSNNLLNNTPSALFVNAAPSVPAHFVLKALPNPARDTGASNIPVLSDLFLIRRPQNGQIDIGATEGH